jgi:hypothetical protein
MDQIGQKQKAKRASAPPAGLRVIAASAGLAVDNDDGQMSA